MNKPSTIGRSHVLHVYDALKVSLVSGSMKSFSEPVHKTVVLTIYMENDCMLLEHAAIKGKVVVCPDTPTMIQTTLRWNDKQEELAMRVKFSSGQKDNKWSSLKLSCEYRVRYS